MGGSGGFIATLTIVAEICPLDKRPLILGGFGATFGIAGVIGPLLGGQCWMTLDFELLLKATMLMLLQVYSPITYLGDGVFM